MSMEAGAYLIASAAIGAIWFDELWEMGERIGSRFGNFLTDAFGDDK